MPTLAQHTPNNRNTQRILYECSCIIEFIKSIGEKDKMYIFVSIKKYVKEKLLSNKLQVS